MPLRQDAEEPLRRMVKNEGLGIFAFRCPGPVRGGVPSALDRLAILGRSCGARRQRRVGVSAEHRDGFPGARMKAYGPDTPGR